MYSLVTLDLCVYISMSPSGTDVSAHNYRLPFSSISTNLNISELLADIAEPLVRWPNLVDRGIVSAK